MQLLGVGVVGENATELVHIGLMALMAGAGQELFIETCFNYPTRGQLYKYATYDAMGRRNGHTLARVRDVGPVRQVVSFRLPKRSGTLRLPCPIDVRP